MVSHYLEVDDPIIVIVRLTVHVQRTYITAPHVIEELNAHITSISEGRRVDPRAEIGIVRGWKINGNVKGGI